MDNPLILNLVTITIFTLMLAIGVNLSIEELLSLWRRPVLLLRALLAVVVLVPLVVIILLRLFDLSSGVATGLALLAASPGAPLTTKRSQMAGGNFPHSVNLQLTLASLAILITPFTLDLLRPVRFRNREGNGFTGFPASGKSSIFTCYSWLANPKI